MVGGDLNSALLFDTNYGYDNNGRLWANLDADGLCDVRTRFQDAEQRTYFKDKRGHYQLDHVFADAATCAEARSWRVIAEPAESLLLSDHAPVEVVLA